MRRAGLSYRGKLRLRPTSPSSLRDATSPCRGGFGSPRKVNGFARGSPTRGAGAKRLRGCTKTGLPSVARPALLRHIGPQASSGKLPGLPKPLPLGEVALRSNDGEGKPVSPSSISTTYDENMNKNPKKPYRSRFRSAIIFYACYKNLK